jgi:quaternary ammonium compound-resistance protein SugE
MGGPRLVASGKARDVAFAGACLRPTLHQTADGGQNCHIACRAALLTALSSSKAPLGVDAPAQVTYPNSPSGWISLPKVLTMAWLLLTAAGLCEIGWAIGLKYTEGFTRLGPSAATLFTMTLSVVLLGLATKSLPIGTAYAVWVGIGAAGTAILGMILFNESAHWPRLACLGLIVIGVVGLKLVSPSG